MEFKKVSQGLPKFKITTVGNLSTAPATIDCIVFDGSDKYIDQCCIDDGFHESITHYIELETVIKSIKTPD